MKVANLFNCKKNSACFIWSLELPWYYWCQSGWIYPWKQLSFEMLGFSSKFDWDTYIISFAKGTFKRIGALFCCMKFLSSEVALFINTSTIRPCMEYCCHVWAGVHNCYWKEYTGLLILHLLLLLNRWLIINVDGRILFYG